MKKTKLVFKPRKLIKNLSCLLGLFGFILLLGTAGATDSNTITLTRTLVQSGLGFSMFIIFSNLSLSI